MLYSNLVIWQWSFFVLACASLDIVPNVVTGCVLVPYTQFENVTLLDKFQWLWSCFLVTLLDHASCHDVQNTIYDPYFILVL